MDTKDLPLSARSAAGHAQGCAAAELQPNGPEDGRGEPQTPANCGVLGRDDLTCEEKPGGPLAMPRASRTRKQRKGSNSQRDSNNLGSGVST